MNFQGRKRLAVLIMMIVLLVNLFPLPNGGQQVIITPMTPEASAADVTMPAGDFFMLEDSNKVENGKLITLENDNKSIGLGHTSGSIPSGAKITWQPYDDEVINLTFSDQYTATVTAVGPGYSQLAAIITYNGMDYRVDCQVHVPLALADINKNVNSDYYGLITSTKYGQSTAVKSLQLKFTGNKDEQYTHYLVKLKQVSYLDSVTNHTIATTGSAICTTPPAIIWESSNESVATVDPVTGMVQSVGAGYAEITVTTTTVYQGSPETLTFPVFVAPTGKLSSNDPFQSELSFTASSPNFTIETNAKKSSELIWTAYEGTKVDSTKKIDLTDTTLMTMSTSDISGSVSFTDVKAGTYYIIGRPSEDYIENSSQIKQLVIKVTVPVYFGASSITMNVGDYYDILDNSNIPSKEDFTFSSNEPNYATVDSKGLITAMHGGDTVVTVQGKNAFASIHQLINVKVVDGMSLNVTNATIYTGSKLPLILSASNTSATVNWVSSDPAVATVDEDGIVTGVKPGNCVITATQKIQGVTKKVTCKILVLQSVTSIVLDPSTKDIAIKDYLTINASITPKINNTTLHWVTSDPSVVAITESGALSATVQGVAGGTAVVTAINKDNIVVGSCLINVYSPIESITLSESSVTVPLSQSWFQLYATILPYSAEEQELVWTSSDTSILTVDSNGKVKLKKSGTASVIVTSKVNATISAICKVTVTKSVTGLTLDVTHKAMYVGETFRLTYTVKPSDSSNTAVTWSSSNSSIASVDKTGLVSAKAVGTTVILVKTSDGGFLATCTIIVSRTATAVKLDVTTLTLNVGDYYYFETALTPADSTETTLSWESSDSKVASVSKKGKVIGKASGTCVIMVKTKSGSTGYCTVKVIQPVTGIELSSEEEHIYIGDTVELEATLLPTNATEENINWSSTNTQVATVDEHGTVKGVAGGMAVITAETDDGSNKAFCMVYVEELVTEIKLSKTYYRLGLGRTYRLTATINAETATNKQLEWSSSNTKVATVDQYGRVKGITLGTAVITATATDGSEATASCTIRVCRLVTSIDLNVNYITLVQGKSYALKATVKPSNATYKTPVYSSNKTDIAIVNKNGMVTGLTPGNAIITAKANDSSGVKAICYVNVIAPISSTSISLSESEIVMSSGETKTVAFSIIPNNSTDTVTWSSDNTAVATVNATTGKITAKAIGTANITIMTESGRRGSIKVYVVGLSKSKVTLPQYTSTLISLQVDGAGSSNLKVRWDVDDQEVATVVNGKVTGKALGTTKVYAVVNGRTLTCTVTVTKIP